MLKMFAVYDKVSNTYSTPFFVTHEPDAVRSFVRARNDPNTNLYQFPDDFNLQHIGDFSLSDGSMIVFEHKRVVTVPAFKEASNEDI